MAGGATTPAMAAAVSEAGGLGFLGAGYQSADKIRTDIRAVRALTDRPFGVNLFVPNQAVADPETVANAIRILAPYYQELGLEPPEIPNRFAESFDQQVSAVLEEGVPVFSFTFGIPSAEVMAAFRAAGTAILGTATSVEEGRRLEQCGVDAIVAQGIEAGGHRGTFIGEIDSGLLGLVALVPQLVDAGSVPVVASGGIMDARGIVAALALGASGVQMGTAFLTARESGISEPYRKAILDTVEDRTQLTRAYSGGWARGIETRFMTEMAGQESQVPAYPVQNALTKTLRQEAAKAGRPEFLSLWAGQATALAQEHSAGKFVADLVEDTHRLMVRLGGGAG